MQAIELEAMISLQGNITLPPGWEALHGRHARMILLLDDAQPPVDPKSDRAGRQRAMRQALTAVAHAGTFAHIDDAASWQREARTERAQPGRED